MVIIDSFQIFRHFGSTSGGSTPPGIWVLAITFFINVLYVYIKDGGSMKNKTDSLRKGKFIITVFVTFVFNILNSISASVALGGTYFYQMSNVEAWGG